MDYQTLLTFLLGGGVLGFIQYLISRHDNKHDKLADITKKLDEIEKNQKTAEKDALRTQLLMMIASYPEERTDIMRLAEFYFHRLDGNWVAKAIFLKWLTEYCDGVKPEWFKEDK